ncbi:hypothetical protein U879_07085 [Defluviimonas sp. 20V17]|nr:hypothetical protein U879_07085 [Defluviimonas sp. 20V17]
MRRVERSDFRFPVVINTSNHGVLRRPVESAQYLSIRYTERLDEPSTSMLRIAPRVLTGSLFMPSIHELLCLASSIIMLHARLFSGIIVRKKFLLPVWERMPKQTLKEARLSGGCGAKKCGYSLNLVVQAYMPYIFGHMLMMRSLSTTSLWIARVAAAQLF